MNWWRNRKVGWGIGRTKLWLVQYRQYLRAMHAQYVARDLLSPLVTYGDTPAAMIIGDDGKPKETDPTVHPGEILNLPPVGNCSIQYPDGHAREALALIDGAIRDLESPRVTRSGMEGAGSRLAGVVLLRTGLDPSVTASIAPRPDREALDADQGRAKEKVWSVLGRHRRRLWRPRSSSASAPGPRAPDEN